MTSDTMRVAAVASANGPFDICDRPRPIAGPGELLVEIHASGVNPLDLKIRAGEAAHARHPFPAILGIDLAGTVAGVGAGVEGFDLGQAVFGMTGGVGGVQGSLAEYAAVDARLVAPKPENLTMREAAAVPLAFITAWEGLVDRAHMASGQRVLVMGGAGGVGHIAIQIARAFGAEVHAVDDAARATFLESLGAIPIDREEPVASYCDRLVAGRGYDIVYDTVGGPGLDASFKAVARFGHVVTSLGWGTHALAPLSFKAASYSGIFSLIPLLTGEGRAHHGEILRGATRLIEAGHVRPNMWGERYGLEAVADAHLALESRTATGKVVVDVGNSQ